MEAKRRNSGQETDQVTGNKSEGILPSAYSRLTRWWAWEWIKTIITAFALALFVRTFFIQAFRIPTGSMEPTLHGAKRNGDKILVNKVIYGIRIPLIDYRLPAIRMPNRGDVMVFATKDIKGLPQNKDFIKRVVGLGGETISIRSDGNDGEETGLGHVYVNGIRLKEPKSIADRLYYISGPFGNGEVAVPKDSFFVLGDNSRNSRDSRFWGFVPYQNLIGKAVVVYWPPGRLRIVR